MYLRSLKRVGTQKIKCKVKLDRYIQNGRSEISYLDIGQVTNNDIDFDEARVAS